MIKEEKMEKGLSVTEKEHKNFIENIIAQDLESGKHQEIVTRFHPSQMVIFILVTVNLFV